ncbi:MAG TPA: aminopeptidase N [Propionibacteriaceae bacterium]|nr:aminopeptidase N [Propionibacteriaceae bacterium]
MSQTDRISLLRGEAVQRAQLLRVRGMRVELDLTAAGDTFTSRTTLDFDGGAQSGDTFVDVAGVDLLEATLDSAPLDHREWKSGRLPLSATAGSHTLVVEARMSYASDGEGLHRHVDPADQQTYLYAMSFLDAAPRWFACFDQPDLKSPYQIEVRAPEHWTVLGNGPSVLMRPGLWRIGSDRPLSTYQVTLVAGPYVSVLDSHDGIPLGIHARASLADHLHAEAPDILEVTKASFDYYHGVFGVRYPFGQYHQAFVPDFNAGAMENPGCVTFRDRLIFRARATAAERATRAGTIAHEMAHMWFGNLVTLRWWDDLWLNESFAEYLAHRCGEVTRYPLWTEFGIVRKDWGAVADQSPSTHPVARNGSADAQAALADVDGISYAKGAAVLKQLVSSLGEPVFWAGLRDYFDRHAFANAEMADLMAAWKRAGAVGLDDWAKQWLHTEGMDRIEVRGSRGQVQVVRTAPPGSPAERTHAIAVAGYDTLGAAVFSIPVKIGAKPVTVPAPTAAAVVLPDATDDTWASIRPGDWDAALRLLPVLRDPAPRVVLLNAVRDAVRNAELDPADALAAICAAAETETSEVVLHSILTFAADQLCGAYASPLLRSPRTRAVNASAGAVVAASEPGSDRQLAAFRIAVHSSDDPPRLSRWLAGELPDRIILDAELRWAVVDRLSMLTCDPDLIEETLRQDPTASAQIHAAHARAGLPDLAAKETAWRVLMQPSSASAYIVYATASSFFTPTQTELTAPFVAAYFDEIADTARFRTGWALGRAALLAYPASASTPATLRLAEGALARPDLPGPIRRSLVDGTDRLRRAVAAITRFERPRSPSNEGA